MIKQRFWSYEDLNEEYVNKYLDGIKNYNGSLDEVWFCVADNITFEEHKTCIEYINKLAKLFRDRGIRVSLQCVTIGRGVERNNEDAYSGVKDIDDFAVDATGLVYNASYCWYSRKYRNYYKKVLAMYTKVIKPYAMYFDDDMSAHYWDRDLRCCCPHCIAKFNKENNLNYTREELEVLFNTNIDIRDKYLDFIYNSMADYSYEIGKAIHEACATTHIGVQHGAYAGYGFIKSIEAFHKATGLTVFSRSGGGAYSDKNPNELIEKTWCNSWQLAMLPDCVEEKCPEIENYPHVFYGKSIYGTCLETSLNLAVGFNCASYAVMCHMNEPAEYLVEMSKEFSKYRKYWEKLIDLNKNTTKAGLKVYLPKNILNSTNNNAPKSNAWLKLYPYTYGNELQYVSIPTTYENVKNPIYLLNGNYVECMTDKEIEFLFDKTVITDGFAIEVLEKRGFGSRLSVKARAVPNGTLYMEKFNSHIVNKDCTARLFGNGLFMHPYHEIIDLNGKTEPIGEYAYSRLYSQLSSNMEIEYKICDAIAYTDKNIKWLVLGFREWDYYISYSKKCQLVNAIDYISDNQLPCILRTEKNAVLTPRENKNGKITSITVLNNSIEETGELEICVRNALSDSANLINNEIEINNIKCKKEGRDTIIKTPNLKGWNTYTIYFN